MKFTHHATYPASFEKVIETATSEEFLSSLTDMPETAVPERRSFNDDGKTLTCEIFWQHTGQLDPMANMLLKGKPLTWVQTITINKETKTGTISTLYMEGAIPGSCEATVTYTEDGDTTTRDIEGEIIVKIMMAGPTVEKRLAEGIQIRYGLEADALSAYLSK